MNASVDNLVYGYDATSNGGLVSYDGNNINIKVGDPGDAYGTDNGAEGVLFEETKQVTGPNGRTGVANIPGAYPNSDSFPIFNSKIDRTKNDKIFGNCQQ